MNRTSWLKILRDSDYAAGCPVVAATLDAHEAPEARDAATAAFKHWERLLADAIARHGVTPERARAIATLAIAAIEGAIILSRAERSAAPMVIAGSDGILCRKPHVHSRQWFRRQRRTHCAGVWLIA